MTDTYTSKVDSTLKSLELQSLDTDSLFSALSAVENAIPVLLACVKPILANLSSPASAGGEISGEAKESVAHYMDLLDKIQFVLRQTVYYLHETKASSNTLRPPHPNSIPTPFASTLPDISISTNNGSDSEQKTSTGVELGLYGKRIEARTLKEMIDVLGRLGDGGPALSGRRARDERREDEAADGDYVEIEMEVDERTSRDVRS